MLLQGAPLLGAGAHRPGHLRRSRLALPEGTWGLGGPGPSPGRTRGAAKPDTTFAQQPNTLWCWDITHLRTTTPWVFLYLYVLLDWVGRKVIAWHLAETLESREVLTLWDRGLQNERLLELPTHVYPRSLSDRGTQMRSRLTRRFFARTGVEALYARPRTPNDNPEIEAFFSTLKGRLNYPGRFESLEQALTWCAEFFRWYNGNITLGAWGT